MDKALRIEAGVLTVLLCSSRVLPLGRAAIGGGRATIGDVGSSSGSLTSALA